MEPVDKRITAAQLMELRKDPNGADAIAAVLSVSAMPAILAARTRAEIAKFIAIGDATMAAQIIHGAMVRQRRAGITPKAFPPEMNSR